MKYLIITASLVLSLSVRAQLPSNRIKPGVMYHAGDTVHSPRIGLTTRIPEGWSGLLPREEEVFLLASENGAIGEIYVMVNLNTNLQTQRQRWVKGMNVADGLRLESAGEIAQRGAEVITTMGKMVGNNANQQFKIYLEAKCSSFGGFCVSYVATADPGSFEKVKTALQAFVDNTVFSKPSNESPYTNFDWKAFLSGKVLLAIGYEGKSKREDQVSLCPDGSFRSDITRTGIFKGQAKEYQGRKKGKWSVTSDKEKATITFTFEKLPPVEIGIEAKDEEIYVKGQRYFVGESEECK